MVLVAPVAVLLFEQVEVRHLRRHEQAAVEQRALARAAHVPLQQLEHGVHGHWRRRARVLYAGGSVVRLRERVVSRSTILRVCIVMYFKHSGIC